MDSHDIVSVIVPIYNVEQYLPRCLDSIVAQSYHELEIILVDDGSKDSSPCICDEYASRDNRICVIHKQNGGEGDARNCGLSAVHGKYIMFVDSDDWCDPLCVDKLYHSMISDNVDLVCGRIFTNVDKKHNPKDKIIIETNEINSRLKLRASVWGKLYKTEIIESKKLLFNTHMKVATDAIFSYKYLSLCHKISILPDEIYHYALRQGSALHSFVKDYYLCRALRTEGVRELYSKFPKMPKIYLNAITIQDAIDDLSEVFTYYNRYSSMNDAINALSFLLNRYKDYWNIDTGDYLSLSAKRFLKIYGWEIQGKKAVCLYWHLYFRNLIKKILMK